MLIDFDPDRPLYIIGTAIAAEEICNWIIEETNNKIIPRQITETEYYNLTSPEQCILGFANFKYRNQLLQNTITIKHHWPVYIHSTASVNKTAKISKGTVIHPMTFVGHKVILGDFCWVSPQSLIGHNTTCGKNVIVSPGTVITGSTVIGNNVRFGQSSSVRDKITIVDDVEFCMASTVTKDISESGLYYGNKKVLHSRE